MKRVLVFLICTCLLLAQGTALAVYATEQAQSDAQTDEQFTQTCMPTSASFMMSNPSKGSAAGTLTVALPQNHNVTSISVFWGDATGKPLPDFAPILTQTVMGSAFSCTLGDGNTVPAQAKTLLVYTKSTRFGLSLSPFVINLPSVTLPKTGKELAHFQVISDMHLGVNQTASDRFLAALADIKTASPGSAGIVAVGDLVDAADDEYYALLNSLYTSVPGAPVLYRAPGHHEYLSRGSYQYDQAAHAANMQKFLAGIRLPDGRTPTTQYYSFFLGGYTGIVIGADSYVNGNAVYSDTQLTWLESTLTSVGRERPVFVFMHEPIPHTVSGSSYEQGYGNVYNYVQVKNLFDKYENVFVFSGHTHWTMAAPRTYYHDNASHYFNTAAVSSLWNDAGGNGFEVDGSQGYYVTVYEHAVLVRGRDFSTGEWLPDAYFLISTDLPEKVTTPPQTAKPSTSTTKPADQDEVDEEEKGLSKEKLMILVAAAGIVALLAFVAVFGIQPKSASNSNPDNHPNNNS